MKHLRPAVFLTAFFVFLTGLLFPLVIWAVGKTLFSAEAGGSFVRDSKGNVVGSALIGQAFSRPEYFHPRPSAAGAGYDAASSGGTNLGPTSDKLVKGIPDDPSTPADESYPGISDLAKAYRTENGLAENAVIPADAVTRSGSGLDPEISPANAYLQAARVAKARSIDEAQVRALVGAHQRGRFLGIFGEPRVNALRLNLALDRLR